MIKLKTTILSLSLITVMAGAAVSPTLGAIGAYFTEASPFLIKQIITLPSFAIMLASLVYGVLSGRFSSRSIAITGLFLYILGGACAGLAQNIYVLLLFRFLLGLGTGLLMPLCTSLISYSFDRSEQVALMGYSSSMNNLGAVLAMIFSSILVAIKWRYSFLVYLIGVPVFLLVFIFLPNVKIENTKENQLNRNDVKALWPLYGAMFITQVIFYALTSNFALVCAQENLMPTSMIGSIMAFQAAAAVLTGMVLVRIFKVFKSFSPLVAVASYMIGYFALFTGHSTPALIAGVALIGFSLGLLFPLINSNLAMSIKKEKSGSAMALMTAVMFFGQFASPIIIDSLALVLPGQSVRSPFLIALFISMILLLFSKMIAPIMSKE